MQFTHVFYTLIKKENKNERVMTVKQVSKLNKTTHTNRTSRRWLVARHWGSVKWHIVLGKLTLFPSAFL